MKESKEPEESHCPSNKDERDPKKEHATAPAAKSSETEENATGSASKSEDTHDKPNPMKTSLARIWTFVKAPEHSNALVAIFTVVITLTGIIYTVFAGLQWSAMKNSIRIDQRAWAISSDFVLSGELNQNSYFWVTGTVINTGKSPALDVTTFMRVSFSAPDPPNNPQRPSNPTNLFSLWPNTTMAKFNSNAYKPSAEDMRAYKDPKGYLFVTETVWYQDVFGTPHWSTVCRWHRYNTAFNDFGFCGWGNAVDRNDP